MQILTRNKQLFDQFLFTDKKEFGWPTLIQTWNVDVSQFV